MKNRRRRVALYVVSAVVVLFVLVLAVAPLLFRGRISSLVKAQVGKNVAARVDWQGAGLSFFHHFPNLTLGLDHLSVVGVDRFQGDTLLSMPRFRLVLDVGSVLRSLGGSAPIVIRAVELDRPTVHLAVLQDGTASWDIWRGGAGGGSTHAVDLSLRRLEIHGGSVSLDDRPARLSASVAGLEESLRGDFRQQRFTVATHTAADTVSLRFGGVPYLTRVRLGIDADLGVDMAAKRVTVRDNRIRLNGLQLAFSGTVAEAPDSALSLDLAFDAPRTSLKEILSLVPSIYAGKYTTLQSSGTAGLSGWVRGRYARDSFPAMAMQMKVENGAFRYPDLPLPARDIFVDLAVTNHGGSPDSTVVNLRRLHILMGNNPVDIAALVRTPVSDPDVDLRLNGRLDLADVGRTIELPTVQQLSGVVAANATMHARVSDVDHRRYDRVRAAGSASVRGLALRAKDLPHALNIDDAELRLSPQHVEVTTLRGKIGKSDVALTGYVDNLLGYALQNEPLRGQATLSSGYFDLNEWRSGGELQAVPVPADLDVALNASIARLAYGTLDLRNARGTVRIKDRKATLQDFRVDMLGGTVLMNGFYATTDPARPTFDFALQADSMSVPAAFTQLATVRAFVPVARFAQGRASSKLRLSGVLGANLVPVLNVLSGLGTFHTSGIQLRDFPPMDRLSELLKIPQLRDPGFRDLASSFEIRDGHLLVKPFDARLGRLDMNVSGSNGIDGSLQYLLALKLPRAALGSEANQTVATLVSRANGAGFKLNPADVVTLGVRLGGSITKPTLSTDVRNVAASAAQTVGQALKQQVVQRLDSARRPVDTAVAVARARADSAAAAARARADSAAARLLADAQQRAAAIRAQARTLAEAVRREANARADSLAQRPGGALARVAARAAADRLRKEADAKAQRMIAEADARADSLVAQARARAAAPQP